jgi:hypothetical protein
MQHLRRGHYDIATDEPDHHSRLRKVFDAGDAVDAAMPPPGAPSYRCC